VNAERLTGAQTLFEPKTLEALADLVAEAKRRWHVYFVIPGGAEHGRDPALVKFWADLLGRERVLALADPAQTSAAIAVAIGANEGVIDGPRGGAAPPPRGVVGQAINAVTGALHGLLGGGGDCR